MSDIYDIVHGSMKLGVAVPVLNDTFRYWDDPGIYTLPTVWAKANLSVAINAAGYDDTSAVRLSSVSAPNDNSFNITSKKVRYWNDNRAFFTNITMYYSVAAYIETMAGGTAPSFRLIIGVDSTEAFPSPVFTTLKIISATDTSFTRHTGAVVVTTSLGDKWADVILATRDNAAMVAHADCVGVMFNPFDTTIGYYELTNIFGINGPQAGFQRHNQRERSRSGAMREYDPSGGAENKSLAISFQGENRLFMENMKRFYDINKGELGGLPGLPLMIEPNLPGYPPTFVCDIAEGAFPLVRDPGSAEQYSGTFTFESVY